MLNKNYTHSAILIASDELSRANLVRNILLDEFKTVDISLNTKTIVQDFKQTRPSILILAFGTLEQCDQYYQNLQQQSKSVARHPYRTLVLCNNAELKAVYELCKRDYFNDYVLFWPRSEDPWRLCMVIHHLLRELDAMSSTAPSAAQLAVPALALAEMENVVENWLETNQTPPINETITRWRTELKNTLRPFMLLLRTLTSLAQRVQATILVVDDDVLQCKMIETMLKNEPYRVVFATTGLEALSVLRLVRPDVVLMDVMMPEMDGITATQRLKSLPQFAQLPVIMVTGRNEKTVVFDSVKAGATGFLVKPFGREALITKLHDALLTPITRPPNLDTEEE